MSGIGAFIRWTESKASLLSGHCRKSGVLQLRRAPSLDLD